MTEPKPPDAQAPPAQPGADTGTEPEARGERLGTVLMAVAIAGIVILVVDVALKGKLLAPLFALLPAPKTPPAEAGDAETRPAGE